MPYQLRFLKTEPMADWLQQLSETLAPTLLDRPWFSLSKTQQNKDINRIWEGLTHGLADFLIRRSQCDLHISCDQGLRRAPENTSLRPDQTDLLEANVTRYQFKNGEDLPSAFEKLTTSLLKEFPQAAHNKEKIETILISLFTPHLFINHDCSHREVCLHSFDLKLAQSFVKTPTLHANMARSGISR